jgi:death-on-curing protein
MEVFLVLNGFEISAAVDELERIVLMVASGQVDQPRLAKWLRDHLLRKT